ncbi:MAG: HAD family hydrolase [Candidatus Eisenbacteria bacterium]
MKILVDGPSVANHARMRAAVLGLALRGHEIRWLGAGSEAARAEAPVDPGESGSSAGSRADVMIGAGRPLAAARHGWFAGASCLVQALDPAGIARWNWLDRWGWQSLTSFALVEPVDAGSIRSRPGPLELASVGLWSDEAPPAEAAAGHADCEILERACERIVSRHRGSALRAAAFLDRDGTLVREVGYLSDPRDIELLPGVPAALARLRAAGFALVLISNQAGVGRGYFSLARVYEAMAQLRRLLRRQGVELDAIYFCPHAPDAGCACRKPGIELLERAAEDLGLQLRASVMIGDKLLDVETGRRAGGLGLLVESGYGGEELARAADLGAEAQPDFVARDLSAAAAWLVEAGRAD